MCCPKGGGPRLRAAGLPGRHPGGLRALRAGAPVVLPGREQLLRGVLRLRPLPALQRPRGALPGDDSGLLRSGLGQVQSGQWQDTNPHKTHS